MSHRDNLIFVTVSSGQTLSGVSIPRNYDVFVQNGGTLLDATLYGATVDMGGTASNIVVRNGGFLDTSNSTTNCLVTSGGVEYVAAGTASHTKVLSGGDISVAGTGTATDVVIASGGLGVALSLLADSVVQAGGQLSVEGPGQVLSGDIIQSGALLAAMPNATPFSASAVNTEVQSGATVLIVAGGTLTGLTIDPGAHIVSASVVVTERPGLVISAGNILSGVQLVRDQSESVYSGGRAIDTTVGASQGIYQGGTAIGSIVTQGNIQSVYGTAIGTTLSGFQYVNSPTGLVVSTMVESGGNQSVDTGSTASATIVMSGGFQSVQDGAVARATTLSGGTQYLTTEAHAEQTTVGFGGLQQVANGGTADTTVILAGGEQTVGMGGALANNTVISALGVQMIQGAGESIGSTIAAGGLEAALGGYVSATSISSGGTLRIGGHAQAKDITIAAGGTIDFSNIAFMSGATVVLTSQDLLQLTEGGVTTSLQLQGTYAGEQFAASQDRSGGTYITLSAATTAALSPSDLPAGANAIPPPAPPAPIPSAPALAANAHHPSAEAVPFIHPS